MFPPVFETLYANNAVRTIVGDRIGAHGEIEQTAGRPYITWQVIVGSPENTLGDLPPIDLVQIQINCLHSTDAGIRALAAAVRDAIEPHAHVTGIPVDQRDPETRLYWVAIQADWWLPRETTS